jgi:phosphoribosylamine---glycine ligase
MAESRKMDVLLVGSGGREHALAWKIAQSPRLRKLYIASGNGGTRQYGENVAIPPIAAEKLADFAQQKSIDLTIVGPDDPLAHGVVNAFQERGLRIFGPTKVAAQIEWSKAFAKQLMREAGIPTAEFEVFTDYRAALKYVHDKGAPIVIKASGLALGKGVYVCMAVSQAEEALKEIMQDKIFREAGNEVVIEEFFDGPEISIHALCDGKTFVTLPTSQDHKRALENDEGKNTGGMGTIAPVPWSTSGMVKDIEERVIRPTLSALAAKGILFTGLLFPGIKMTKNGPKVLEFNARWGDPETQSYMRLMKSDVLDVLEACVNGELSRQHIEWHSGYAVNVVLASEGYPDSYKKGFEIKGIEEAERIEGVKIFHAGTEYVDGIIKTNGGRVLGVSAIGESLKDALKKANQAAEVVQYHGKVYRKDIGAKSLSRT